MTANEIRRTAGRKASREVRRQQLIEATIAVLARKGFAMLTVADVAQAAGLSTGIVIFHFDSKDELLASVLRYLAEEYYDNWKQALATAGDDPAGRLSALLLADFNSEIYNTGRLSAWVAFWGEAQGRPTYNQIYGAFERERQQVCRSCCEELIRRDGSSLDPGLTMKALEALGDGLWLAAAAGSSLVGLDAVSEARRIMRSALAAFFPRHFAMPGP